MRESYDSKKTEVNTGKSPSSKRKNIIGFGLMCIGFTITFMLLLPDGSFDPGQIGFYKSLCVGGIWSVFMFLILRKNWK
jgi:hypothetical protein